jgi:protein-disulfide isomerase
VWLRILYGAILVAALLVGYFGWNIHAAKRHMLAAPMGQSLGPSEKDAKTTLVEFMDYRCSYCRDMAPVMEEVAKQHPETRLVIRHLPVFGRPSVREADFALAAGMQGKFWEAHRALVSRADPLPDEDIPALAAELGLNLNKLQADMRGAETGDLLLDNVDAAQTLGIDSAPSFLVNGHLIQSKKLGHLPDAAEFGKWLEGHYPY